MLNALVVATLPSVTGFPEHDCVNTFPFQMQNALSDAAEALEVANCVQSFYNDEHGDGVSVANHISQAISRAADSCIIRVYKLDGHLDGSPHGSPILETTFALDAATGGTAPLPEQVACVLTTRSTGWETAPVEEPDGADPGAARDRPKQRRSGRVYVGPFNTGALSAVSSIARPSAAVIDALLDAGVGLQADANSMGHNWSVWSRVDSAMRNVTDVQVDDSFDIQRRRKASPLARTTRAA